MTLRINGVRQKREKKGSETQGLTPEAGIFEATAGFEPAHKGFADLSLTTWVPRLGRAVFIMRSRSP